MWSVVLISVPTFFRCAIFTSTRWGIISGTPLPKCDIHWQSDLYVFQQDSAPAHRDRKTADLLTLETPDFILSTLWPPNSPDLNPADYKVWSVMQEKVCKGRIKDVDQLRSRIPTDELDQRVIDTAVRQWRRRLLACAKAKDRHFEHRLNQ